MAGAGGGAGPETRGASGGGISGGDVINNYDKSYSSYGGTQTTGGVNNRECSAYGSGVFGKGGEHSVTGTNVGGGGGGFFGGSTGGRDHSAGGGGSGYINTSKLIDAYMYGYDVSTSNDIATKTYSTTNYSETPTSNYAKSGHGAARITPVN